MRRKLISQGKSTLTVSLPKPWVRSNKLTRGDELEVLPAGRELRLIVPGTKQTQKLRLDVSKMASLLVRATLNAQYVRGAEEIHVTCTKAQHRLIQDTVDNLIGMAIVEQRPALCVVRDVTAPGEVEFDSLLRRIYRMVLDLAEECLGDFQLKANGKPPLTTPTQAAERDFGINRFVYFTLRQLSRQGHLEARRTAAYFHLVMLLELVADEYTNLWKDLVGPSAEVDLDALALYRQVLSMTKTCYELLYTYDSHEAAHVSRSKNIIRNQLTGHVTKGMPLAIAFHIRKIAELSVNLLQAQLLLTP